MNDQSERIETLKSRIRNEAAVGDQLDTVDGEFTDLFKQLPPLQAKRVELQVRLQEVDQAKVELAQLLSQDTQPE